MVDINVSHVYIFPPAETSNYTWQLPSIVVNYVYTSVSLSTNPGDSNVGVVFPRAKI